MYVFRRLVGQLRGVVPEQLDLAFAVQRLSRELSSPVGASMARLKKLCRYVVGTRFWRLELRAEGQGDDYPILYGRIRTS